MIQRRNKFGFHCKKNGYCFTSLNALASRIWQMDVFRLPAFVEYIFYIASFSLYKSKTCQIWPNVNTVIKSYCILYDCTLYDLVFGSDFE